LLQDLEQEKVKIMFLGLVKMFLKYFLKDVYADKTKMEEIITNSDLKWTVVRPGRLLDKELTEKYRIENTLDLFPI
jgi:hypothetical protein